jgi:hypothetical protein
VYTVAGAQTVTNATNSTTVTVAYAATDETIDLAGTKLYLKVKDPTTEKLTQFKTNMVTSFVQAALNVKYTFNPTTPDFDVYVQLEATHGYERITGTSSIQRVDEKKSYQGLIGWSAEPKKITMNYPYSGTWLNSSELASAPRIDITSGKITWTPTEVRIEQLTAKATCAEQICGKISLSGVEPIAITNIEIVKNKTTALTGTNGTTLTGVMEKVLSGNMAGGALTVQNGVFTFNYPITINGDIDIKSFITALFPLLINYSPPLKN